MTDGSQSSCGSCQAKFLRRPPMRRLLDPLTTLLGSSSEECLPGVRIVLAGAVGTYAITNPHSHTPANTYVCFWARHKTLLPGKQHVSPFSSERRRVQLEKMLNAGRCTKYEIVQYHRFCCNGIGTERRRTITKEGKSRGEEETRRFGLRPTSIQGKKT